MITELGAELVGSPLSLYVLEEPTGLIVSFSDESDLGLGTPTGPILLTVSMGTAGAPLLGDVNLDGVVDFFDIAPFILLLSNGGTQAEADINQSGEITFLDIQPFIEILSGQ